MSVVLRIGSKSPEVGRWQTRLKSLPFPWAYSGEIDNDFGPLTDTSTREYQKHLRTLGLYSGDIDGIVGPLTFGADAAYRVEAPNPVNPPIVPVVGVDARSKGNIDKLHPKLQPIALAFMAEIRKSWDFRVTSGLRTYAEQQALYDQGRTKPGNIVTNARPGYSTHNFGLAFDITLFDAKGQPVWTSPIYDQAGQIGKKHGLDWGGDWKSFTDKPHFEYRHGKTLAQLRNLKAQGIDVLS